MRLLKQEGAEKFSVGPMTQNPNINFERHFLILLDTNFQALFIG